MKEGERKSLRKESLCFLAFRSLPVLWLQEGQDVVVAPPGVTPYPFSFPLPDGAQGSSRWFGPYMPLSYSLRARATLDQKTHYANVKKESDSDKQSKVRKIPQSGSTCSMLRVAWLKPICTSAAVPMLCSRTLSAAQCVCQSAPSSMTSLFEPGDNMQSRVSASSRMKKEAHALWDDCAVVLVNPQRIHRGLSLATKAVLHTMEENKSRPKILFN